MKSYEKYISKANTEEIHESTLRILNDVGILFENDEAVELFKKHGAKTDGYKVFISESMVNGALESAPSKFMLRLNESEQVQMGNGAMLSSPIGQPAYICSDGAIRRMTPQDAVSQFKMSEACTITNMAGGNVAMLNGLNMTQEQRVFAMLAIALKYSGKYQASSGAVVTGIEAKKAYQYTLDSIDLSMRFRGVDSGAAMLTIINSLSPLTYDSVPIEKMMAYVRKGQAVVPSPCAMPLLTGPASVAGIMSMTNAEIIAGTVFAQLCSPGAPVIYGNTSAATDMSKIQLSIGSPESALMCYATAALADYYNLPFRTGGALSDAKQIDAQAGAETMMMLYATYDTCPDYVLHNAGCMGMFNVMSPEKFVIDEEIARMVQRMLEGVDCSDECLLFEEIKNVGPRGTFLHGRTPAIFRKEFIQAKIFNKDDPNNWQNQGSVSVEAYAKEEAERRISEYVPPEITKEQHKLIKDYLPKEYKDSI